MDDILILLMKKNIEKKYYIVEKHNENYIQESRIDKIICLIEDENKCFCFYILVLFLWI